MEQCNMDLKSIEVFLSVLKYQVLLEYLVIYSSYKIACSLARPIANYIQPKHNNLKFLLGVTNVIGRLGIARVSY